MEIPPHCRIPLSSSSVEVPKRFPESRPREQNGVCLSVLGRDEGGGGSQKRKTVPLGLQIGRIPVTEEGRRALISPHPSLNLSLGTRRVRSFSLNRSIAHFWFSYRSDLLFCCFGEYCKGSGHSRFFPGLKMMAALHLNISFQEMKLIFHLAEILPIFILLLQCAIKVS